MRQLALKKSKWPVGGRVSKKKKKKTRKKKNKKKKSGGDVMAMKKCRNRISDANLSTRGRSEAYKLSRVLFSRMCSRGLETPSNIRGVHY